MNGPCCRRNANNLECGCQAAPEAVVSLNNLLNAMAVLVEEWEKDGAYLNNPHDDPEVGLAAEYIKKCAKALKKIASSI